MTALKLAKIENFVRMQDVLAFCWWVTFLITWFSGQHGEILHEGVQVFSRAKGNKKN